MSEFTKELPTKPGFYLIKNDNFELAAELVEHDDGAKFWHTTELEAVRHHEFSEGTQYKRMYFS